MPLKPVPGVFGRKVFIGMTEVVTGPISRAPFPVDAVVFEEDTYQVLSASNTVHELEEHPVRTLTEAFLSSPAKPGTVIVSGRNPLRLQAIVHDLNQNPTWREEWIRASLQAIFQEVEKRAVRTLAVPILGAVHGSFSTLRFVGFLREVLNGARVSNLKVLWLIAQDQTILNAIAETAPLCD